MDGDIVSRVTHFGDRYLKFWSVKDDKYNREEHPGLMVTWLNDKNEKPAFYDLSGKELFHCEYDYAFPFSDGRAIVIEVDTNYPGYPAYVIDRSGKIVGTLPRAEHVVNPEGPNYEGFISTPTMGWIGEGLASFSPLIWDESGMRFELGGYWNLNGETVLSLSGYSEGYAFCDGYAVVRSKETNQYGYIDKTGKEVIPCVYDNASGFQDGLAYVLTGEKWGVIDKQSQTVISPPVRQWLWRKRRSDFRGKGRQVRHGRPGQPGGRAL